MKEDIRKLNMELEHLERTHKAGIIKEKEFLDNKLNIEKKIQKLHQKLKNEEDSNKIIADILQEPPKKEKIDLKQLKNKQLKNKPEFVIKNTTKETKIEEKQEIREEKQPKKNHKIENTKHHQIENIKHHKVENIKHHKVENLDMLKTDAWSIAVYLLTIILIMIILLFSYKYTQSQQVNTKVVTIYEYADYACPYSKDVQKTLKQLKEYYKDHLIIVHKHFPLEQLYPGTTLASESVECANKQKAFIGYERLLYEKQELLQNVSYDMGELQYIASQLDLNMDQFKVCQKNHEKALEVQKDIEDGKAKGIISTPTFLIGSKKLVGAQSFEVFKYYIEQERKK